MNNRNHNLHKNKKNSLIALSVTFVATILIISFILSSSLSSAALPINVAESGTQLRFDMPYAYVGECTANMSYTDSNNRLMYADSLYPSAILLNITRVPGIQIASCDAEIEIYGIHVTTDTGVVENHAYFSGTNYNPTFSRSQLSSFVPYINDLINKTVYSTIKGNFQFNWTENTAVLTRPVGSIGLFSSFNSTLGLWSAGKPNDISVTVERIGYITTSNGSVSIYKDLTTKTAATVQLSNYSGGFLYNTVVPAAKLSQTDLFHPNATLTVNP
jgi:hypothetical protein